MMVYKIEFMPTYLMYKYFFFIPNLGRIRFRCKKKLRILTPDIAYCFYAYTRDFLTPKSRRAQFIFTGSISDLVGNIILN